MFFIGIDLSDKFLDSCMVDSATDVLARSRFDFTNDGFCSFIQHIQEHGVDNQNCIIGLENPLHCIACQSIFHSKIQGKQVSIQSQIGSG